VLAAGEAAVEDRVVVIEHSLSCRRTLG